MSENSLELRNKFINKINNKIKDLNDNIALLAKVDNKIFKNSNSQFGGANQFDRIKNINRQRGGVSGQQNTENVILLAANVDTIKEMMDEIAKSQEALENTWMVLQELAEASNTDAIQPYLIKFRDMNVGLSLHADEFNLIRALFKIIRQEQIPSKGVFDATYSYTAHNANNFISLINLINTKIDTDKGTHFALNELPPDTSTRLTEDRYNNAILKKFSSIMLPLPSPPMGVAKIGAPLMGAAAAAGSPAGQKYRRYY